jgi:hypothetical protein
MGDSAHTTHHTNPGKKRRGIAILMKPREPIFEKSSHLREKGGVLMLFKTTPHLGAKAQYRSGGGIFLSLSTPWY